MNKRSIFIGLIVGTLSTGYSFAMERDLMSGSNMFLGIFPLVFLIGGMIYVDLVERKENEGFLTFKEGFTLAATVGIINTLLSSLFTFVNLYFIKTKEQLDEMINMVAENMVQKGVPSTQAYEIASKSFNSTYVLLLGFIGGIFMALILAAIIAASISKKKPLV